MKYRDIILLISASAALTANAGSTCQSNPSSNISSVSSKKSKYDSIPNLHRVDLGAPLQANQTCALWQECKGRQGFFGRDMKTTTCRTDGGAP